MQYTLQMYGGIFLEMSKNVCINSVALNVLPGKYKNIQHETIVDCQLHSAIISKKIHNKKITNNVLFLI